MDNRLNALAQRNDQLRSHHRVFAFQTLESIASSASNYAQAFSKLRTLKVATDQQISTAARDLLETIETQAGLGQLNIFVWKKEAVTREITQAVERKHREVKWRESDDPLVSPTQR